MNQQTKYYVSNNYTLVGLNNRQKHHKQKQVYQESIYFENRI